MAEDVALDKSCTDALSYVRTYEQLRGYHKQVQPNMVSSRLFQSTTALPRRAKYGEALPATVGQFLDLCSRTALQQQKYCCVRLLLRVSPWLLCCCAA